MYFHGKNNFNKSQDTVIANDNHK